MGKTDHQEWENQKKTQRLKGILYKLQTMRTRESWSASYFATEEETDSRIILYCLYAKEAGYKFLRVTSPDSNAFFILVYHAIRLKNLTDLFETGKGNQKRCLDIGEFADSLTPALRCHFSVYAFSGCDSYIAFNGKGKVAPIKV